MNYDRWRDSQVLVRETLRRRHASDARSDRREPAPLVSVIVVCWNAADVLGRCLEQLFAQDYPNYEVIVVDDGSDDATEQVARRAARAGELKLVRSDRNHGCPSARNLGLGHAAGEIVAFIDADGFADARWLSEVVAAFGEDASVGGIASTVFFDDNPLVVNGAGGTVNQQGWAADLSMNQSYEFAELARESLYPMGCGMALRREAIERVGPFDDRMLNYYDDVDYGVRLWRAGYRIVVAPKAWVDHGFGATGGDSARKRLLCERHRMRVVIKHASGRALGRWLVEEARSLGVAPMAGRVQKLRSIAWNARHLPSLLAARRGVRGARAVPDRLSMRRGGTAFLSGSRCVCNRVQNARQPASTWRRAVARHSCCTDGFRPSGRTSAAIAGPRQHAALLVHLDEPAKRLRLDYAHVPVDVGSVDVRIRRVASSDPLESVWETRLPWQYLARSVENHPIDLAPGDYEVSFAAASGWSDPPRETRSLSLALSRLLLAASFDIPAGGLDIGANAEDQLVSGWFETEAGPSGPFRWGGRLAAAVVRVVEPTGSLTLGYCLPPASIGSLRVTLTSLGQPGERWSTQLPWRDGDWHNETFAAALAPGDYRLSLETETSWSNPDGGDLASPPENRALGFALASLSFGRDGLR